MGSEQRAPGGFPGSHGDVRVVVALWIAVWIQSRLPGGMVHYCGLPGVGTLDRAAKELELGSDRVFSAQRSGQQRVPARDAGGGNFSGWFSRAVGSDHSHFGAAAA